MDGQELCNLLKMPLLQQLYKNLKQISHGMKHGVKAILVIIPQLLLGDNDY